MSNHRKLQLLELEILKKFISVCEEYDLKYYALYGTALGAVRHKGFIPWDDDIDVGMSRKEVNRFLELAPLFCDEEFTVSASQIQREGCLIDIQNRKHHTDTLASASNYPYIDILVIDGLPNNAVRRTLHYALVVMYNKLYSISRPETINRIRKRPFYQRLFIRLMNGLRMKNWINSEKVLTARNRLSAMYGMEESRYCGYLCTSVITKGILRAEWFGEGVRLPFEDVEIAVPQDYHSFLSRIYGDYMTPVRWSHGTELTE
ncbi:MAG: LicD family protein [Oscillospiraceae bacterium]|jgi:lipopolysaccharide cholinephosphotransferase|nr:LicD family protein [Oscillospiraceae bacterium]